VATEKEQLDQQAGDLARKALEDCSLNRSPWPTFELPEYSPWLQADDSYIEQDLYSWTKSMRISRRAKRISERYPYRFDLTCFETNDTNEDYYKRSTRDYSIKVQALTRGNALMTNMHAYRIFPDNDQWGPLCPHCPGKAETEHHVFTECTKYAAQRQTCSRRLQNQIDTFAKKNDLSIKLTNIADELISGSIIWPGRRSQYYLGLVPRLHNYCTTSSGDKIDERTRITLSKIIHSQMVTTAGFIWSCRMKARYELNSLEQGFGAPPANA